MQRLGAHWQKRERGGPRPHSQTGPKYRTAAMFVVQTLCHRLCCPCRALVPPLVTSSNAAVIACHAFCPPLPRVGCSCCPCERLATTGACDWVSPPPPLPLFSSSPLSLLFFLAWGAPSAVAFLTLPLRLLPHAGADISRKLIPSVSSP